MKSRKSDPGTRISPSYTFQDWRDLRPKLDEEFKPELWRKAVEIFSDRIQNRFFKPVRLLQDSPETATAGFGFAIMALDCLLVDTLQAFREGRVSGNQLQSTSESFIEFLRRPGFRSEFRSRRPADDFVTYIRNGLLHDGETRK